MTLLERRRALMGQTGEKYVFVEYLESTGTQWIDTGFKPDGNTTFDIDYQFTTITAHSCLIGVRGNGSDAYRNQFMILALKNKNLTLSYGDIVQRILTTADTNRHSISMSEGRTYIDDTFCGGFARDSFTCYYDLELFAGNNNGVSGEWCSKMKLYSCQIYDNGTLVRDFKPCYRKRDKVGGIYDTVSGTFYENQGTGNFLIGGEI